MHADEMKKNAWIKLNRVIGNKRMMLLIVIVLISIMPYRYRPGGQVVIISGEEQKVQAEQSGTIEYIVDTRKKGQYKKKGTLLARIHSEENGSSISQVNQRIEEEMAKIDVLRKEISANRAQQKTYIDQSGISGQKYMRWMTLYRNGAVTLEATEDAKRQYYTDVNNLKTQREEEKKSIEQVDVVKMEIARLIEERKLLLTKKKDLEIRMPIDGYLDDQRMDRKLGMQVAVGDTLVKVRGKRMSILGRMQVSEIEAPIIRRGQTVEIRMKGMNGNSLRGSVQSIANIADVSDRASTINISEDTGQEVTNRSESSGRVINVLITIDKDDESGLVPGMTGQAKIDGQWLPVGYVFTRPIIRYMMVEVWSWLP